MAPRASGGVDGSTVGRRSGGLHWSFWGVLSLARVSGRWAHPGLARGVPLAASGRRRQRARPKGRSSTGRAAVSKTAGCRFKSCRPCSTTTGTIEQSTRQPDPARPTMRDERVSEPMASERSTSAPVSRRRLSRAASTHVGTTTSRATAARPRGLLSSRNAGRGRRRGTTAVDPRSSGRAPTAATPRRKAVRPVRRVGAGRGPHGPPRGPVSTETQGTARRSRAAGHRDEAAEHLQPDRPVPPRGGRRAAQGHLADPQADGHLHHRGDHLRGVHGRAGRPAWTCCSPGRAGDLRLIRGIAEHAAQRRGDGVDRRSPSAMQRPIESRKARATVSSHSPFEAESQGDVQYRNVADAGARDDRVQ